GPPRDTGHRGSTLGADPLDGAAERRGRGRAGSGNGEREQHKQGEDPSQRSGRPDSNRRLLAPKASTLTRLSYAPFADTVPRPGAVSWQSAQQPALAAFGGRQLGPSGVARRPAEEGGRLWGFFLAGVRISANLRLRPDRSARAGVASADVRADTAAGRAGRA